MKRDIKQITDKTEANGTGKQANGGTKRAKMIVDGQTVEKVIQIKATGTVFEEKKSDLVIIPRNHNSVLAPETKALRKAVVTDARAPLM